MHSHTFGKSITVKCCLTTLTGSQLGTYGRTLKEQVLEDSKGCGFLKQAPDQSEQRSTNIRGTKVLGTVQIIMVNNRSCYQVKVKSDFPPFTFVHILLWKFTREWVQFLWKTFRDLKVGPYAPTKILILQCKQASKISAHIPTSQPDGGLEASGHDLHSVSKVFPTRFLELPGSLNVLPSS